MLVSSEFGDAQYDTRRILKSTMARQTQTPLQSKTDTLLRPQRENADTASKATFTRQDALITRLSSKYHMPLAHYHTVYLISRAPKPSQNSVPQTVGKSRFAAPLSHDLRHIRPFRYVFLLSPFQPSFAF